MSLDLEAIKRRVEKATPGPWPNWSDDDIRRRITDEHGRLRPMVVDSDATFIAHARTDVPLLISELERARAENAQAQAKLLEAKVGRMELAAENEGLRETLERARAVLARVEWAMDPEQGRFCMACCGGHPEDWRKGDRNPKGHAPDCELAALIGEGA